jgi:hypothetical protein
MPKDSGLGSGICQNVKATAKDKGLSHPCTDAQRLDFSGLKFRPVLEGGAGFAERFLCAVILQLLKNYILVTVPLVSEAIFVFLDLSGHK